MSEHGLGHTLPESVLKTQETLRGLSNTVLAISDMYKSVLSHYDFSAAYTAINTCVAGFGNLSKSIGAITASVGLKDAINAMQTLRMSSVAESILPLIDVSKVAVQSVTAMTDALRSVNWDWLRDIYTETLEATGDEDQSNSIDDVPQKMTPEIREEIAADISEVFANPAEMQSVSQSKYLQWKARNPGFAAFFLEILYPLLLVLLGWILTSCPARLDRNSQVYTEPAATSNVVYNLTVENNITVIGDAPYYYEVEFVNPETGEPITGYVYKGNITIDEPDNEEVQGESEITEVSEAAPDTEASQTKPTE